MPPVNALPTGDDERSEQEGEPAPAETDRPEAPRSGFHHLELWTADLAASETAWHWLLTQLGWRAERVEGWDRGRIWRHADGAYLVLEQSPDVLGARSERRSPGMNHLALTVPERALLDSIRADAAQHGWRELFADAYPHAGGAEHTAWYGEDPQGIEVELVAQIPLPRG